MILPYFARHLRIAFALLLALGWMLPQVHAQSMTAGSVLVYPEIDGRTGVNTFVTVTNVNSLDSVDVRFTYVDRDQCDNAVVIETLTPRDTLTVITGFHGPPGWRGYLHIAAVNAQAEPITFNSLIGSSLIVDGFAGTGTGVPAFSFQGLTADGAQTDLNGNGEVDLNGVEYEFAPDEILIPRFFAENVTAGTEFVLIGLTGGLGTTTTVSMILSNDNEVIFSAQYSFDCWARVESTDISFLFTEGFLLSTNQDPSEPVALSAFETGWLRMQGAFGINSSGAFQDPAILAFAIERPSAGRSAELPFLAGDRSGGSLRSDASVLKIVGGGAK